MTFSIPIDIKRCILEGIEPPDDAETCKTAAGVLCSIKRHVPLIRLSPKTSKWLAEQDLPWKTDLGQICFFLRALPQFPLLMPDDDFAAAINEYAAKWRESDV